MYDHYKRSGTLYNKLCYRKYGKGKAKGSGIQTQDIVDELTLICDKMTLEEQNELALFFKTFVIKPDNVEILKSKMRETIEYREKVVKQHETKFGQLFPMYFLDPSLVGLPIC